MTSDDHYLNPVYGHSFPDPFILKFRGEYFGYSTGLARDGSVFQVIRSFDLVDWHELRGAMVRLETDDPFYWAPEVTYYNGKFYLYYSVGNETLMHLRVAVADKPDGPFIDSGHRLTTQEFAIDPHVFRDDDGRWFMFYATDFLTHTHIGTGTVVDRMIDPFTLAGEPRPVSRAKHDWQVYDPARREKGGVKWHTVEGPTVLKRKGLYFEMFSGGNWQNVSYGVSYAVTDDIDADQEWHQHSDGITTLPILRTLPGEVIGPGHNSVIRGPNNRELYCVYHRWVGDERVLAIDRMDLGGGDRMLITGPTFTPQMRPYRPHINGFSDVRHMTKGKWRVDARELRSASTGDNEMRCAVRGEGFLAEMFVRGPEDQAGRYGVKLDLDGGRMLTFIIDPRYMHAIAAIDDRDARFPLPAGFAPSADHHIKIECDHRSVVIQLDSVDVVYRTEMPFVARGISLLASGEGTVFSGFTLTYGFEELFDEIDLAVRGWTVDGLEAISFDQRHLIIDCEDDRSARLTKPVSASDHELVLNICPVRIGDQGAITLGAGYRIEIAGSGSPQLSINNENVPVEIGQGEFIQVRVVSISGQLELYINGVHLASLAVNANANNIFLDVVNAVTAVDMIRFTGL